jgi:hypothetical protein
MAAPQGVLAIDYELASVSGLLMASIAVSYNAEVCRGSRRGSGTCAILSKMLTLGPLAKMGVSDHRWKYGSECELKLSKPPLLIQ